MTAVHLSARELRLIQLVREARSAQELATVHDLDGSHIHLLGLALAQALDGQSIGDAQRALEQAQGMLASGARFSVESAWFVQVAQNCETRVAEQVAQLIARQRVFAQPQPPSKLHPVHARLIRDTSLKTLATSAPGTLTDAALLQVIQLILPQATQHDLRRELERLEDEGWLKYSDRSGIWHLRITGAGEIAMEARG